MCVVCLADNCNYLIVCTNNVKLGNLHRITGSIVTVRLTLLVCESHTGSPISGQEQQPELHLDQLYRKGSSQLVQKTLSSH